MTLIIDNLPGPFGGAMVVGKVSHLLEFNIM